MFEQRALGRLWSAARERAPTQISNGCQIAPSSSLQLSGLQALWEEGMPRLITSNTSLDNLKKEAKRWLKALRAGDADARARLRAALPDAPAEPALRDVQHALAREYGLPGWNALKFRLADEAPIRKYERVAEAAVKAYEAPDPNAMRIVWNYFGHMRAWPAMRRYMRLDLGKTESPQPNEVDELTLEEARWLVARAQGFESWDALEQFAAALPVDKVLAEKAVALVTLDHKWQPQLAARSRDWDEVIALSKERRIPGLGAMGQMTNALLARIAHLEHIEALDLNGSHALTDEGLYALARLPRLKYLNLGGCGGITDRGLEVLRQLPALEWLGLGWTRITDSGVVHVSACEELKRLDVGGTGTGDGAIRALAGKSKLRELHTGNGVTDDGLAPLHDIPAFAKWQPDEASARTQSAEDRPNLLSLRGAFTDDGMRSLVGLNGLYALDIDSAQLAITGKGLVPLAELPHLERLGFDAKDESMPYIAALPHLRFLFCQDTSAGDDGFVALSRSRTLEHIWGRRCYNLRRRGFVALADLPALRYLSVSCKNVDDVGLSALPRFPALRELMPMDVPDDGYRHIGHCTELESLVLMYCRDTGDVATSHITGLTRLKKYFASYNRITDRTPELLSTMDSLEEITFDTCAGLTNAGVAALARLPRLKALGVSGMPRVTSEVVGAFPERVRVRWAL
jgi:hypothetical protein